jgi:hypothetical protein
LEEFIQQNEQAGAGLVSVVARTVMGIPFNVVEFVFEPEILPPVTLHRISTPIDTDEQRTAIENELTGEGLTALFFAPVKLSRLVATFGAPLRNSNQLLNAHVEIFNPDSQSRRFARVPLVDVGPGENQPAEIDLTLALDQYLKTNGSAHLLFRIVV